YSLTEDPMKKFLSSRIFVALAAVVVTALVVGGVAYAAKPPPQNPLDANGNIHSCYNPKSGAVKLKTTAACAKNWTEISWSQNTRTFSHGDLADNFVALGDPAVTLATLNAPATATYQMLAVITVIAPTGGQAACDIPNAAFEQVPINGGKGQIVLSGVHFAGF